MSVQTNISAKIPQGLKVTLSKALYEQIIETTKYATSLRGPAKRLRTTSVVEREEQEETPTLVKGAGKLTSK